MGYTRAIAFGVTAPFFGLLAVSKFSDGGLIGGSILLLGSVIFAVLFVREIAVLRNRTRPPA